MDFIFIIPLKKEDILKGDDGQYVAKLSDFNTAYKNFRNCRKNIVEKGCESILEYFDIIFSMLQDSQEVSFNQLQELWDSAILLILEDLRRFVTDSLQNKGSEMCTISLNILKMNVYIVSLFIKVYEEKLSYQSGNFIGDTKKGKTPKVTKSKTTKYDTPWDWNSNKKTAFTLFSGVLEENLQQFWDPPVVEEQFVNLLANCCYKAYGNPEITLAKMKPLRDSAAQVLAVLVNKYNHGMTFIPKCVQLLKQYEHAVSAIHNTALIMVVEFKCTTLLSKMIRELINTVREEDVQTMGKSVATFITNISESNPELLVPSIKVLSTCLTYEPYILRNAVLTSFSDIIIKCFSSDELPEEEKKSRANLLKFLHNHLRDQSSYVRSKALQLWTKLANEHAIPKNNLMSILRTAKFRLSDSSSHVIKSAIQFFKVILKDNPYAGMFNLADMKSQLAKAKENLKGLEVKEVYSTEVLWNLIEADLAIQLNVLLESENEIESLPDSNGVPVEETMIIIAKLLQNRHFSEALTLLKICEEQYPESKEIRCNIDRSDTVEYYIACLKKVFLTCTVNFNPNAEEIEQQKLIIQYIEDVIAFVLLILEASKEIEQTLYSNSIMEAFEAIEFFTTAYKFNTGDSRRVVRQMILLVWSKVPGMKEAVIEAFKSLYLISNKPTAKGRAIQVSNRLIKLLKESNYEHKSALEELIHIWFQNGDLNKEFIQVLWEKFSKVYPQVTNEESIASLMIIEMIAEKNPQVVLLNLQVLIDNGLTNSKNLPLVENVCRVISKISSYKVDKKLTRLYHDHEIFFKLSNIMVEAFVEVSKGYIPMATSVIIMTFKVCCYPLKVMDKIIKELYNKLIEESNKLKGEDEKSGAPYNEMLLGNLLHVYGESIFRKWQYFDRDVYNSLKKDVNSLEDEFETESKEAANDALTNAVNEACENLVYVESSLDAHLRELVVKVCYGLECSVSSKLSAIASSTLAKLMMVSHSFCENNIQVLVTIMEKSPEETVRANVVMGFGDIINKFPNIADPWTSHLYGRLKDNSVLVRSNTVIVLTHLITREMVKVRGQIAEFCLCLEDPEPFISERVRYLLTALSQKGNSLYNVVPDIISRLSNPDREEPVSTVVFNRILGFIFGLLGKERQNDVLVDKLCCRLQESTNETQWGQLSYCLSCLNYSEKSLKKLIEAIPSLKERLLNPDVYSAISSVFNTATKAHFSKPQLKELANEGLELLEEVLTGRKTKEGKEDDTTFMEPKTSRIPPRSERKLKSSKKVEPNTPCSSRLRNRKL